MNERDSLIEAQRSEAAAKQEQDPERKQASKQVEVVSLALVNLQVSPSTLQMYASEKKLL